jgi:hypothetical protein
MVMSPQEVDLCRGVVRVLRSEKSAKYSTPFLTPFSLEQVPGYLDICPKVMDISTLSDNLETGKYDTRKAFFDDCFMIFNNAIKYHSDKDATNWLVAPAQNLIKIVKREQAKVEKKLAEYPALGAMGEVAAPPPLKKVKKEGTGPKLKLKLGGSASVAISTGSDPKPKIKIKQPVSQGKTPPSGAVSGHADTNKKPRLTLKIGKPKIEPTAASTPASVASAPTPKSATSTSSSSKISVKMAGNGGSRGKELPKGIAPPEPKKSEPKAKIEQGAKKSDTKKSPAKKGTVAKKSASKTSTGKAGTGKAAAQAATVKPAMPKTLAPPKTTSTKHQVKTKITLKAPGSSKLGTSTSSSKEKAPTGIGSGIHMTPARKAQCFKVLNGLRRRQAKNVQWFEKPITDKKLIQDYRARIKHPMDLSTMQSKLENDSYPTVAAFVLDLRRIFGNCLQYNTTIVKDSLRSIAVETLNTAEQLLAFFLAKPESPQVAYPPLVFCWTLCLSVLDTLYNLTNPDDKNPTAFYFVHPVAFYFGGTLPSDYLEKAPKPMDFGTITAKLVEGQYSGVDQFESDCNLVISNCMAFNGGNPESKSFCDQATRLNQVLQQQLEALNRYIKSPPGQAAQKAAQLGIATVTLPKPPVPLLLSILTELRDQKYTDKMTKITEPAMASFEEPVSVTVFPDYIEYIQTPMDLRTVERKIKSGQYASPEDFEYDMLLMFQNCITYYGRKKMDHLVALGKNGMKHFRRIFSAKMKILDDGPAAFQPPQMESAIRKDPPAGSDEQGPSKKLKIDPSNVSRGKTAPRISLSATTISDAVKAAQSQSQGRKSPKLPTSSTTTAPKPKPNQPVPLHIAIAQVKERFPLRRNAKSLQNWEANCAKFFKELMRHPWISAARPKFIFHVPVSVLFPVRL